MDSHEHTAFRNLQQEAARLQEENRQLHEEMDSLHASLRALTQLQAVANSVTSSTDAMDLLRQILRAAIAVVKASEGSLLLRDEQTDELMFTVSESELAPSLVGFRLPPGEGIAGWVARHGEPQIVPDVLEDPRFTPRVDQAFDFRTRALMAAPLMEGGRVLGVIEVVNKTSNQEFTEEDLDLLLIAAQLAARAIAVADKLV